MAKRKKTRPKRSKTEADDDIKVGYYCVAFLDLLGQQEAMHDFSKIDLNDPLDGKSHATEAVKKTFGQVDSMRRIFDRFFEEYGNIEPSPGFPAEHREHFKRVSQRHIYQQNFSDTVIAFTPLGREDGSLGVMGVAGLLNAAAGVTLNALSQSIPIRGGVDVGIGMAHGSVEIYGPVLAQAYSLESSVADYPRIVAGRGLIEYLATLSKLGALTDDDELASKIATVCRNMLACDTDGIHIVDYLGPACRSIFGDELVSELEKDARTFAQIEWTRYRDTENQKLATRYDRLRRYFEDNQRRNIR